MTSLNSTLRAIRFFALSSADDDPDELGDDFTSTEDVDESKLFDDEDGDLDFEQDDDEPSEDA